jgi:hypothetical protein
MERWKPLFELYEISDLGNIRRKSDGKKLKTENPDFLGYCHICLKKDGVYVSKTVHRLVAESFIENPKRKREVHHINGIKTDNRAENLEWVDRKEHAVKDKERRNGKPTKHRENFLARKNMSF